MAGRREEKSVKPPREEEYIVTTKGKRKAVVLGIKRYEELLEDLEDLRILAERRDEPTSSLREVKERLRKRGLL